MPTLGEPDYYHILGVRREASPEEIKQAYHRLATRFHPDLHPDNAEAEACLRSLNQAYTVLKDPEQRARYDRWGAWGPPIWHPPGTSTTREWMAAVVDHLLTAREHIEAHKPQRGSRPAVYPIHLPSSVCAGLRSSPQRSQCALVSAVFGQSYDGRETAVSLPAVSGSV